MKASCTKRRGSRSTASWRDAAVCSAVAACAAALLVGWITLVNWCYLLLQIAMATEDIGLAAGFAAVARFIRAEFRELAEVFGVVLVVIVASTVASFLAWS